MRSPRISVIVPVHNAKRHLVQCLDSILAQTERDIEVICVDDGSTDSSPEILDDYASRDNRVRVIRQENAGAGAARNHGLALASGQYLSFLDSDDFFEPGMLATAADRADETDADIVVFGSWVYDEHRDSNRHAKWLLRKENVPDEQPFDFRSIKGNVFLTFGNCPWNKLYRASFVIDNNLRFQEIVRANDVFFTCTALLKAKRISTVDDTFVHYRVANSTSLQATNDLTPLSFFDAFSAAGDFLRENGLYEELERDYANFALDGVIYNANSLKSLEGLKELKAAVSERIEPVFRLLELPDDSFDSASDISQYRNFMSCSLEEYLFRRSLSQKMTLEDLYWYADWAEWTIWKKGVEINELKARIEELENSSIISRLRKRK